MLLVDLEHQTPANNGGANTGDGGDADFNNAGFGGGSGIVVVRYKIASLDGTAKATGGSISFTGGKTIHVFTSSGTFHNPTALTIDYLIIGGGGAGGSNNGGGGGAGGVVAATGQPLPASPRAVVIGGGGNAHIWWTRIFGPTTWKWWTTFNSILTGGYGGGGGQLTWII